MQRKLYEALASAIQARANCARMENDEWFNKHEETIERLISDHLPGGGGFDDGTKIDWLASNEKKLVFYTSFHHTNDVGMYDGWTEHTVKITPAFVGGFNISVSGQNKNNIKDYIAECFRAALTTMVE